LFGFSTFLTFLKAGVNFFGMTFNGM